VSLLIVNLVELSSGSDAQSHFLIIFTPSVYYSTVPDLAMCFVSTKGKKSFVRKSASDETAFF
jgi:hypothetical protein